MCQGQGKESGTHGITCSISSIGLLRLVQLHLLLLESIASFCVLRTDNLQQIFRQNLCASDLAFFWTSNNLSLCSDASNCKNFYVRDVYVHRLVGLLPCLSINETRALSLNLHSGACLLLYILHKHALRTYDFRTDIEIAESVNADIKFLLWPLSL